MKHRLRRALAAVAVLASTLVVGTALPAQASTDYQNKTYVNNGFVWGYVDSNFFDPSTQSYPQHSEIFQATFTPPGIGGPPLLPDPYGDFLQGAVQLSGGSATLSFGAQFDTVYDWVNEVDTCASRQGDPTQVRIEIRTLGGSQVGGASAADWTPSVSAAACGGSATKTVYFDNDPLDNDNADGPLAPGTYEIYLKVEGGTAAITNADSRGAHGQGTNNAFEYTSIGKFYVTSDYQYQFGMHMKKKVELDDVEDNLGTGNQFGLVRLFNENWDSPDKTYTQPADYTVRDVAAEGKAVAWSAKPPAWSGTCGTWTSGGGCPNGGTSPWARATSYATSAPAGTVTMRTMIRQLQDYANQQTGPSFMTITISHEPHDNAIDGSKGWKNGGSTRKCGTATDPSQGDSQHDPCLGTSAEYKAMYAALKSTRDNSCASDGTTGGTGYPCSKVLIQYIGVVSNMTAKNGTGTNVGDGDLFRPASGDYDILGADPYNYACFDDPTNNCSGDGGWKTFEQAIDDPSAAYDRTSLPHYKMTLMGLAEKVGKRVILDEVGSHPGCDLVDYSYNCVGSTVFTSRETWMRDAYIYLATDAEAKQFIIGWIYFHIKPSSTGNDWRFESYTDANGVPQNPDSRGAASYYQGFGQDSKFLVTANNYTIDLTP